MESLFNLEWRLSCSIRPCSVRDVDEFIQAHYLRKRPAIVMLCLMMLHSGKAVGCIVYAAPPREVDRRYGGKTWELARLYLLDEIPKNAETWLISKSVKFIKNNHPEVRFLLSYADPSAGHRGTIYQAANWKSDGRTDQERKTPRFDLMANGKKYGRASHVPIGEAVTRIPRVSKWRFFLPIGKV